MTRFIFVLALFAVLFMTLDASAQSKKRIAFKKGYAEITATIRGDQTLEYVFRASKNTDIEIWIDHSDAAVVDYPKFLLYQPNGKLFYDTDSVNTGPISDMMDILTAAGDYKIRLQLPEGSRRDDKPVKFTLRLSIK